MCKIIMPFRLQCLSCVYREKKFINPFNTEYVWDNCDINGLGINVLGTHNFGIYIINWCKMYSKKDKKRKKL